MTVRRLVQLVCANAPRCDRTFPVGEPTELTTVKALREYAVKVGWETMKGKHGRDVCGKCRIAEIEKALTDSTTP
jgi:hypothetical protein